MNGVILNCLDSRKNFQDRALVAEGNPGQEGKRRGIMLAEHIIDKGVDSICCREDIHDKGPGLMFYRFGIDVRKTEAEDLETLLQDYFSRSESVFPRKKDSG